MTDIPVRGLRYDARSWDGLEEMRPVLRAYLARRCRDDGEMEDVIQDTLVRAARYRSGLRDDQRLEAWVMRIARNVLADHARVAGRLHGAADPEGALAVLEAPSEGPSETLVIGGMVHDREQIMAALQYALMGLCPRDRCVLEAWSRGDGSGRSVAAATGVRRELVKVRLYRARQRLLCSLRRRLAILARAPLEVGS